MTTKIPGAFRNIRDCQLLRGRCDHWLNRLVRRTVTEDVGSNNAGNHATHTTKNRADCGYDTSRRSLG